jgi:hypothetical protein
LNRFLPILLLALLLAAGPTAATTEAPGDVLADAPADAPAPRFDGRSAEAFAGSVAAIEAGMGEAQRLAFRLQLLQARNKLAEQRDRAIGDAEFAAALDGKTVAELAVLAEAAPVHFTLEVEDPDDT